MQSKKISKILVLYTSGEFPARKTVWSFLYSFRNFSNDHVYYHNLAFSKLPWFLTQIYYDVIVYSHFVTTPWNRTNYLKRLNYLTKLGLKTKKSVAFFQDEYFNVDLTNRLIRDLQVQHVFSVAPPSEWKKIYPYISKEVRIHSYLTGYVDPIDVIYCSKRNQNRLRPVDIGYRTGWPSQDMYKLGQWGALKFKLAEAFVPYQNHIKLDIGIGTKTLTGKKWLEFLLDCRYTLGVESGASLLDQDGKISLSIQNHLRLNPKASFAEVEAACFSGVDGNLHLRALSPRIFEAALTRTCQILVEGDYNSLLKPNIHYISLKPDFSNTTEIIQKLKDETLRLRITENAYQDLIASEKYTYEHLILNFYRLVEPNKSSISIFDYCAYIASFGTDFLSWVKAAIWSNFANKFIKLKQNKS